jgi:TorA maturation chaperone TorD
MVTTATHRDALLTRAGVYQLLATAFAYPSVPQRRAMEAILDELARRVDPEMPLLAELAGLVVDRATVGDRVLEAEHNRLFSGLTPCPPYETALEPDAFRRQHLLADIAAFHRAFGFELPEGSAVQADHVGAELELCALLLQREGFALEPAPDRAAVCADALRSFLEDHLGRWIFAFVVRLEEWTEVPLYAALADLTGRFIAMELQALGLRPQPVGLPPLPAGDEDDEMRCGGDGGGGTGPPDQR